MNPFEDVRRQPEAVQSKHAQSAPPAAALSTGATGAPFGDPAKMRLEDMPPLQQQAPVVGGNPESLRFALFLKMCLVGRPEKVCIRQRTITYSVRQTQPSKLPQLGSPAPGKEAQTVQRHRRMRGDIMKRCAQAS